jgi:crossover junction endodeoxyribonuclease RuvC
MRVLGIDPGTGRLGWALVDKTGSREQLVACGCIETSAKTALSIRLAKIYTDLSQLIAEYQPEEAAVEELYFARNVTTALSVGHARGVVILAIALAGIPHYDYKPAEIKLTVTGYGAADKKQVQKMVSLILKLKEEIKPDDAADAVAVALTHLAKSKQLR